MLLSYVGSLGILKQWVVGHSLEVLLRLIVMRPIVIRWGVVVVFWSIFCGFLGCRRSEGFVWFLVCLVEMGRDAYPGC